MSGVTAAAVTTDREPADAAEVLASLVARTTVADLPKGTLSKARLDLLDTLGCAIAGENADGVAEARHLLFEWGGSEQSAVWGSGLLAAAARRGVRQRDERACPRLRRPASGHFAYRGIRDPGGHRDGRVAGHR
jgi:hypothetical protein